MVIEFVNLFIYILVFARLAGCVLLSPIFGQTTIPMAFRMGFILLLTLIVAPMVETDIVDMNTILLVGLIIKEILVGIYLGFILNMFLMLLSFISDVIDTQMGLAMAKTMDPTTNVQNASVGAIITYLFLLFFFASNAHLRLLELYMQTYSYIDLGSGLNIANLCGFVLTTFISMFEFCVRLGLPFIACEFVLELSLGILMKMIPQIHVFVINIQLKLLLGVFLLVLLAAPIGTFMDSYIKTAMNTLQEAVEVLGQ